MDEAAAAAGVRYFVAGATARDLMLVNAFGLAPGRATRDIDFGIAVETWDQVVRLKRGLVESREFEAAPANIHRLYWKGAGDAVPTPIDMIPFGGVASGNATIAWPPRRDLVMNVAGFEEALETSVQMRMDDDLVVSVASVPALAIMKLIAWQDRRHTDNRDAADLYRLLAAYADAGNLERIYDEELGLLEGVGYDLELAGSQLLGWDAARLCRQETHRQIRAVLCSEHLVDQLVRQMLQAAFDDERQEHRASNLLSQFTLAFL